jgi:hypothetical protein
MYGFSEEKWEYIWKGREFHESYKPNEAGYTRVEERGKMYRELGHEVIPYEDRGVSVGLYIMRKTC